MSSTHEKKLRQLVRFLIEEIEVLGEPDFVEEREDDEGNESHHDEIAAGIPGATLPLGMGTKKQRERRRKDATSANASGFGGAKPYKNKK